jgi:small neutral amino acid transporter SnatA (MarC family)
MFDKMQAFTLLFLLLGPFKIIGSFAKITQGASPVLTRQIAFRAIIFSSIALLLTAFLGEAIIGLIYIC